MAVPVKNNSAAEKVMSKEYEKKLKKVYVWELPVRIFHWVNAAAILILLITGFYIAQPFVSPTVHTNATPSVLMSFMRNVHFYTAFIFTITLIFRFYWTFKGNKYARSYPHKKEFWTGVFEVLKYYLFLPNKKKHYIGHNPMAEFSYWIFVVFGSIVITFTGYYLLFEPTPHTWYAALFAWVPAVLGDSMSVRAVHHWVAWGFVIFTIIHIYMAFRDDWLGKNGSMSSIFTGYKTEEVDDEDER
ncbi:Ni/Fe-hydrogenase, b-type cytochrome subunit [Anaerobacillus sp. CMMVII]|uniref:Ni/Fe-hydrogenase, b-type cytochrome subunit n=1 Tax=Anaerobacillus sp. CMMVII TaxID=2755588 RepID=UPI0021B84182|nr:Ni/Fe-hydrogenase, b-type cytochrome subunit [Anaerobacillus sp. CMMVII]MCT8138971.1 Ni/Fe-hydrogenase, b-type cytochrome subunit [Anaerobacillus sp. CMMVII]